MSRYEPKLNRAELLERLSSQVDHQPIDVDPEWNIEEQPRDSRGRFVKPGSAMDPESSSYDPEADENDILSDLKKQKDPEADDDHEDQEDDQGDDTSTDEDEDDGRILSRKLKAKVDGVEEEVSIEEMLRSYQKARAADERLRRASEIEKDLAQRQQQLLELQNRLLERQNEPKRDDPAKPSEEEDAQRELMDAIFSGDEEKAAKAMARRDRALEQRLSENFSKRSIEIEQQAIRRASEAALEASWNASINDLAAERDDVASDEFLSAVFNRHLADAVGTLGKSKEAIKVAEYHYDAWAESRGIKTKRSLAKDVDSNKKVLEDRAKRAEKSKRLSVGTPASAKSRSDDGARKEPKLTAVQEMMLQRKPHLAEAFGLTQRK